MYEYSFLTGLVTLLVLAVVALVVVWALLRQLDTNLGVSFKYDTLPKIHSDPLATAVYFGLRIVAACYLVGSLFSRIV